MGREATVYGRRKVTDSERTAQDQARTLSSRDATVYGSRKGGPAPVEPEAPAQEPNGAGEPVTTPGSDPETTPDPDITPNPFLPTADNEDGYVSVEDLKAHLEKHPEHFDAALKAEIELRDPPRKGALRHLRELEAAKPEPRIPVLKILDDALKA